MALTDDFYQVLNSCAMKAAGDCREIASRAHESFSVNEFIGEYERAFVALLYSYLIQSVPKHCVSLEYGFDRKFVDLVYCESGVYSSPKGISKLDLVEVKPIWEPRDYAGIGEDIFKLSTIIEKYQGSVSRCFLVIPNIGRGMISHEIPPMFAQLADQNKIKLIIC